LATPKPKKKKPKHAIRSKLSYPKVFAAALKQAQAELDATPERPTPGQRVQLKAADIKTQTELFQPRSFWLGSYELDNNHVQKLEREIELGGELDPLVVIKLKDSWVLVDGHHRLKAYENLERQEPIICEWFAGSVLEASDLSVRSNRVYKLEMNQHDKMEMAWRRVLLGGYSKQQLVDLCGVAYGTIGNMRKVLSVYNDAESEEGKQFRARLKEAGAGHRGIDDLPWQFASMTYKGVEPEEISKHEAAVKLAGRMHDRLGDRLSKDPQITASALAIYDRSLPQQLQEPLEIEARLVAAADAGVAPWEL
jgi:hypothetical protein